MNLHLVMSLMFYMFNIIQHNSTIPRVLFDHQVDQDIDQP